MLMNCTECILEAVSEIRVPQPFRNYDPGFTRRDAGSHQLWWRHIEDLLCGKLSETV